MATKNLTGPELVTAVSILEASSKRALRRISDLNQYEHSGSADEVELKAIRLAGDQMRKRVLEYVEEKACPIVELSPATSKPTRTLRQITEKLAQEQSLADELHKTLDKTEAKLRLYNLPKRISGPIGCEEHLKNVREYMVVTWRDPAKIHRKRGYKCLSEWTVELAESGDPYRRAALNSLKEVLVEIGTKLSRFLMDYVVLVSASLNKGAISESLDEVERTIRNLSMTGESNHGSVVIGRFVALVSYARRTMTALKKADRDESKKGLSFLLLSSSSGGKENDDLFHMIVLEILRLEVSFCSPDLLMMLRSEVYVSMAIHLPDNVFKDKLERIAAKIDGMKRCYYYSLGKKDYLTNIYEQVL